MGPEDVMRWVHEYERAWREDDVASVATLFTEDAVYRTSPYDHAPKVGHEAIESFWLEDADRPFTMAAEVIAIDGDIAVVRVEVVYERPQRQEYRDLWVLRIAPDGRVADFEEWAYWPGKPSSADDVGDR